jgi:hypothetical protein
MSNEARPAQGKSWRDVLPIHPAADLFPLMSPDELKALGEDIGKNGLRVPVVVWSADHDSEWFLLDGRNRLDALETLRRHVIKQTAEDSWFFSDHVLVEHVTGCGERVNREPPTDPYEFVLSANVHRRHLSAEQKRELIAKVLKAKPEASNRQIAKQVKADDKTVATVRRELEATAEIPQLEKTTGADGKARPTKRKRRDVDDFLAEKRARKAKAGDIEDAINRFIRNITDHTTDYCLVLRAWLDEKHPDLPDDGRGALEHTLHQCANEILLLAQAIREAAPAKMPEPAAPTRAAAIPTTPAANEMPDLPEFLRRTA